MHKAQYFALILFRKSCGGASAGGTIIPTRVQQSLLKNFELKVSEFQPHKAFHKETVDWFDLTTELKTEISGTKL
jgi:hypothetical protein